MRVALYLRVSTTDRDQNPETQLLPLKEYVAAQGWTVHRVYGDRCPATDLIHREAWRALIADASKRRFDVLLVFSIDRPFRSVLDAASTLERLRGWGVGLRSYCEPYLDTTSPFGEAMYYITCAWAQLERGILAERTRVGLRRAVAQGKKLGRPKGSRDRRKR